ncbi:DUF2059 domain-containing protein [Rhodobacteraceae bacterium CCMM004]|nr:DUF2059 domain-containing protein [Rhodobacteraceae bacterium CCMM004]
MTRLIAAVAAVCLAALPLRAAPSEDLEALYDALGLPEIIAVMRDEGRAYGADLADDLFPGRDGGVWTDLVDGLYDTGRMESAVRAGFFERMEGVDVAPLLTFFGSETGARIVRLEVEARRALMDEAVEEAAREHLDAMRAEDDDRLPLIDAFVEANDLVEQNVVGAMNANYAFYTGLASGGGAMAAQLTEEQILADVWAQEPEIRADTSDWVYSYLTMAYGPLEDAVIASYTDLSRTQEGQALNQALFGAFDEMYVDISRAMGAGAAQVMAGEDI